MVHKTGPRPKVVEAVFQGMRWVATVNDAYYPEIVEAMNMLTMLIVNQMGQTIDKYEPCEICPPDKPRKKAKK